MIKDRQKNPESTVEGRRQPGRRVGSVARVLEEMSGGKGMEGAF